LSDGEAPLRLTVVLPVYDELESLDGALARYREALAAGGLEASELLVVDDGSRDGTGERAEALAAAADDRGPRVRVIRHARNQGQVAALRTGFAAARGAIVTHNGIDLPFAPERTGDALAPFDGEADVVVVERRNRGANGAWRTVVSWANALAWKLLFRSPFADHNFVQFFRREVLASLPVVSQGVNTVTAELLLRAHRSGRRVVRITAPYEPRRAGRSSIRLKSVLRAARELVRLRLAFHRA
jgi:glycosyltransferase involved in cell wall biosynthesis